MTKNTFWLSLPLCMVIALLAAFLFVSPAFAQDELPPEVVPTEAPAEALPAEAVPTEAAPVEVLPTEAAPVEVLPTEAAPAEELPTEAAPVEETPAAEPSLAEALADADVTLADANGDPLVLASQAAEELVSNGDPYLWVGTTKYSYMVDCGTTPNCTSDPNPIQKAIDDIKNGVRTPTDKTLYFDANTDFTVPHVAIIGVVGLNRLWGAVDPNTGEPTVTINVDDYIEVKWQPAGFTMYGFNINGDTTSSPYSITGALDIWHTSGTVSLSDLCVNNADSDGIGITIVGADIPSKSWNGPVVLERVDSSNNGGGGVYIDNYANSIAPVTIKNSSFNDNGGNPDVSGIAINTQGAVLLDGVSVDNNGPTNSASAAYINNSGALTIKNSVFNGNLSIWGLTNNTITGAVTLDNVYVNENRAGIWLGSKGNLLANNVHANLNYRNGAVFDTCWDSSVNPYDNLFDQTCTSTIVGNITVTNSEFNNNSSNYAGLSAWAKGSITLTNINASSNRGIDDSSNPTYTTAGARLQNYGSLAVYPITVNNSTFNWNSDDGLEILSKGLVTVNKVHADNNGTEVDGGGNFVAAHDGYGMDIDNTSGTAGVTFNGAGWGENSTYGNAYGLLVNSKGNILLNYLDSSNNSYVNGRLDNTTGTGNVTVNKSTLIHSWGDFGLHITSNGVVTLNSVTANENYWAGTYIDNTTALSPKAVTINGGSFDENSDTGLVVFTHGAITLTNISANANTDYDEFDSNYYGSGAFLKNDYLNLLGVQISQPVTVNYSTFEDNRRTGLMIESYGAITLKNVTANGNSEWGAYLDNYAATTPKSVIISGSVFNENSSDGLTLETRGLVNLSGVEASNNSIREAGMNPGDLVHEYVASQFDDTWWIYANQDDVISITLEHGDYWWDPYLELWGFNGSDWEMLTYDDDGGDDNNSQIIDFTMPYSGSYYILAHSFDYSSSGNYMLKYWKGVEPGTWNEVYYYDANGLTVRNSNGAGVTITNGSFNNNSGYGMDIDTHGAVMITNVNASDNTSYGGNINNRPDALTTGGVTLIGSTFDNNNNTGLVIQSNGAVVLTKTIANENAGYGAFIMNQPLNGTAKPAVTIVNDATKVDWWHTGFSGNGDDGLNITSLGVISLTNVSANDNANNGAVLQNYKGLADVKLTNAVFESNDGTGVDVQTQGNIIYNKGRANYNNGGRGAYLTTNPTVGIKNVTITNVSFNGNYDDGLRVETNGNITLTNVQSNNNWGLSPMVQASGAVLVNQDGTGNISISKSSFNGNVGYGLNLRTNGNVTLNGVTANENDLIGASIGTDTEFAKVVAISGMSTFYDNGDSGLEVYATGAITLTNVDSAGNVGYGAYLKNTYGTGNISLLGTLTNWINWFGDNDDEGLHIETNGAVVVNKVDASKNGQYGIYIDNRSGTANVTVNTGSFNYNQTTGLNIWTRGTILVDKVTAVGNVTYIGAWINNQDDTTGTKTVTVTRSNFDSNVGAGLAIMSKGNVILNNISACKTSPYLTFEGNGVTITNAVTGGVGTVTILNTLGQNNFNENASFGLKIFSNRAVSVTGVTANNNSFSGVYIDNYNTNTHLGSGNVTLSQITVRNNTSTGLRVYTNGAANLTGVVSMFNGSLDIPLIPAETGAGVTIHNMNASNPLFKTTITNSVVIGNAKIGIQIFKYGGSMPLITSTMYFGNNTVGGVYKNLIIADSPV